MGIEAYNLIVDDLPETVRIDGADYQINWDFRTSVLFEIMMQDDELTDSDKTHEAVHLFYPVIPPDISKAVEKIIWFYKCGRRKNRYAAAREEGPQMKRVYSFEYDDDYIYAAFMEQYGIDLNDVEGLHWWKFRALLKGLREDCEFVKIMGYRSVEITGKMSNEQKEFYRRMKELYELPISETEQEKEDAITQILLYGGDLTGLI